MASRLYPGDLVYTRSGLLGIVRTVTEDNRVKLQLGNDWTMIPGDELRWLGDVLENRLPRSERHWRKLGRLVTGPLA